MVKEGTAAHGTGADTSVPPDRAGERQTFQDPGQGVRNQADRQERWNAISLSTKLVTTPCWCC